MSILGRGAHGPGQRAADPADDSREEQGPGEQQSNSTTVATAATERTNHLTSPSPSSSSSSYSSVYSGFARALSTSRLPLLSHKRAHRNATCHARLANRLTHSGLTPPPRSPPHQRTPSNTATRPRRRRPYTHLRARPRTRVRLPEPPLPLPRAPHRPSSFRRRPPSSRGRPSPASRSAPSLRASSVTSFQRKPARMCVAGVVCRAIFLSTFSSARIFDI